MGLVETVGLPPKKSIYVENLLLIQYFYDWLMCPKYMWLDMPNACCCRLSLFRVFAKKKKTVSTSPGLPYTQMYLLYLVNVYIIQSCDRNKVIFYSIQFYIQIHFTLFITIYVQLRHTIGNSLVG